MICIAPGKKATFETSVVDTKPIRSDLTFIKIESRSAKLFKIIVYQHRQKSADVLAIVAEPEPVGAEFICETGDIPPVL